MANLTHEWTSWCIVGILVIVVVCAAFVRGRRSIERFGDVGEERMLIVQAEWGMCNRLRSYNVAYEIAMKTGRNLVMINDSTNYEKFWNGDWTKLFHAPRNSRFESIQFLKNLGDAPVEIGVPEDDCGVSVTMAELEAASDQRYLLLRTCEVLIDDMKIENRFYKAMKPTQMVMDNIALTLTFIRHEGCVGVHIRQGNIPDYEQGYFFGEWAKDHGEQTPIMCCFDDGAKNVSPCPKAAPGVERFVEAMKKEPKHTKFFVCSDRPGCMLYLETMFPKRVFYTSSKIEYDTNFVRGFCDWYCLAHCKKLLLSAPSSFSIEAAKLNDVPCEYIDVDE
jgi:hypothetical protein